MAVCPLPGMHFPRRGGTGGEIRFLWAYSGQVLRRFVGPDVAEFADVRRQSIGSQLGFALSDRGGGADS